MAIGRYLLGGSLVDGYLLEDGSNVFFLEFTAINSGINLFIEGAAFPSHADDITLFIYGHDTFNNDIDLFIFNSEIITSGINLFIHGHDTINNDIDLFTGSVPTEFTSDIDLFIHGIDTINNDINLYITGPELPVSPISIQSAQFSASTVPGFQDLTITNFGTVSAALLFISNAVSGNVPVSGINFGIGLTDGIVTRSAGISSEEDLPNTNTQTVQGTYLLYLPDRSSATIVAAASFDSFITDGIRIDWSTPPPEEYTITAYFIGGDLEAKVDTFTSPSTVGNTTHVDVGFEPDQLMGFSTIFSFALDDVIQGQSALCFGLADNGDTLEQAMVAFRLGNSSSIGTPSLTVNDSLFLGRITTGSLLNSVEISGFTTSGFHAATRISNGSTYGTYLALKYNDQRRHFIGVIDSPIESGLQSFGDPGFEPFTVLQVLTQVTTTNTVESFDEAGALGFSLITTSGEFCTSFNERSSTITSNQSIVDTKAINFPHQSGGISFVGTFDSFSSSGWIIDFSSVDTISSKKWLVFAIEASQAVPVSDSIDLYIAASGDSDYWNLFVKTPDNDSATSRDLFIYGSPSGSSFGFAGNEVDLFVKSSILDSTFPPFTSGYNFLFLKTEPGNLDNTGYWPLFLSSNTTDDNSIHLYISTLDRSISGTIDLFIARIPDFPGQEGATPINNYWPLFLKVPPGSQNNIDMFIEGSFGSVSGNIDYYTNGVFVINDSLNLVLYGIIDDISNDIDFYASGLGFNTLNLFLFTRGF